MERSLVSACWASSKDAMHLRQLEARDFTDPASRAGFSAIRKILQRGDDCSIIVARQEMCEQGNQDAFTCLSSHLVASGSDTLTPSELRAMVRKIERCSTLRSARFGLTQAIKYLDDDGSSTPAQIQENVTKTVAMAFSRIRGEGGVMERDGILALGEVMSEQEARHLEGHPGSTSIPTGFAEIDEIISGGEPEDLILITGPTSSGKSAFAQQVSREWGRHGLVYYWSGEMSKASLSRRAVIQELKTDELTAGRVYEVGETRSRRVYYDTDPATMEQLAARVELYAMQYPIIALVIDYIGLSCDSDYKSMSQASKTLVRLKKSLKVPVVALCQMSRKIYERVDKTPVLADLKESGQLENDADKVLMIHRPCLFDKNADVTEADMWIRKNREGQKDVPVKLSWDGRARSFGRWIGDIPRPRNPALRSVPMQELDVATSEMMDDAWDAINRL